MKKPRKQPDWVTCGKSIRQLIQELLSFEQQDLEVRISLDDGETHRPISLVVKSGQFCLLKNCEESGEPSHAKKKVKKTRAKTTKILKR